MIIRKEAKYEGGIIKMDCSVSKRKGCNYCLRFKTIKAGGKEKHSININDESKELIVDYDDVSLRTKTFFKINYCPICGKKFI